MTAAARRRAIRPSPERQAAERRGRFAELLCRWHLRLRGWRILASHWRCPSGEIDILARRGRVLAIIEVKSRRDLASAAQSVAHWRRCAPSIKASMTRFAPRSGG